MFVNAEVIFVSNRKTRSIVYCSIFTDPGSPFHDLFEPRFNGSHVVLKKTGRENIQERIEAFGPYTDLNYMLSRLKAGDPSVLSTRAAMYGDFSSMPSNPIDAINLIHNAEASFSQLPEEERSKHNNDYRRWLAALMLGGIHVSDGSSPASSLDLDPDSVEEVTV